MTDTESEFESDHDRYVTSTERGHATIRSSRGTSRLSGADCDDFEIEIELPAIPQPHISLGIRATGRTDDGDCRVGIAPTLTPEEAEQLAELLIVQAGAARGMGRQKQTDE